MGGFWRTGAWGVLAAVLMVGWVGYSHLAEDRATGREPFKAIYDATPAEENQLTALLGEAFGLLHSRQFHENLLSLRDRYPVIYAKPDDQAANIDKLARITALEGPIARFAPADVVGGDDRADPTRDTANAGEGQGLGRYSQITIGRNVLDQYRSSNIVAQSCAVNVASHEYAHTISTTPMGFGIAFTDTTDREPQIRNRQYPGTPVASYLIGAVAQCTWLQLKGRIGQSEVPMCVETFGVTSFNWQRCNRFAADQPVGPRPDLPEPAPPL